MGKHPIFIIEHLEPKLWEWCLIEYNHISKIVGPKNLWFTNIKKESKKLSKLGKVYKKSVKELNLKNVCVLDGESKIELTPSDSKIFKYYIFGGILGDYPPRKRTKKELTSLISRAHSRNIGKRQFTTDNAVFVVHEILKGKKLSDFSFCWGLNCKINEIESVELPFRYVKINGKPLVSEGLIEYLKKNNKI